MICWWVCSFQTEHFDEYNYMIIVCITHRGIIGPCCHIRWKMILRLWHEMNVSQNQRHIGVTFIAERQSVKLPYYGKVSIAIENENQKRVVLTSLRIVSNCMLTFLYCKMRCLRVCKALCFGFGFSVSVVRCCWLNFEDNSKGLKILTR